MQEDLTMSPNEVHQKLSEALMGMFDGPSDDRAGYNDAPFIVGSFGFDAPEGREGAYQVAMAPARQGESLGFDITVAGDAYSHSSYETFEYPQSQEDINEISRSINRLLYRVMRG